jgi:hypothetical protein
LLPLLFATVDPATAAMATSSPPPPDAPAAPTPSATRRPSLIAALSDVLTADLDENKFHSLHPRRIHWMQNPLD